ncbi:MAG: hypothetical protein M0Z60_12725 [Nitrospiraceae bacterium]|nr:hypothetical protein [Nitrospiraceae bacterium]
MKIIRFLSVIVSAAMLLASSAMALDYQTVSSQDGVDAMISYDPLGPNNQIAAGLKIVNTNDYAVDVTWRPVIACGNSAAEERGSNALSLAAGASYGLNLWRSTICGHRSITSFTVKMEVKKTFQ